MLRYLVHKIPSVLGVTVVASMVAFALPRLAPGDPAVALVEGDADPATIEALRAEMGLDLPLWEQYLRWVGNLLQGDLGNSYLLNRPVSQLIGARMESTIELTVAATLLMIVVGLVFGILGGSRLTPWARTAVDAWNTFFIAVPAYLVGLLLILFFGIYNRVLPVSGEVAVLDDPNFGLQYLILPALALSLPAAATVSRLVQTSMLTNRGEDFVDLAVSKGVSPRRITTRHVARNSLGTAAVVVGLRIGDLLAGSLLIELIFARNGLGSLAVGAVQQRDYLLVQVLILFAVVIAILAQLASEITLAALDPRIRLG
ncbi:ABC transporter permease [Phycicoccus sp. BSK3Z-2]|uniref:ABC transporter permease n=1 Tax=Phycicoccus avicenniae TaxID=2828860 RepID=A0A941I000_9MICO|nr:ABC transporter permease [Phycicoccus avicenniae]MBR7742684.1 ABC transporter permease [Phycicoccus avicenniae]